MNILFVTSDYVSQLSGGIARMTYLLASEMHSRGHNCVSAYLRPLNPIRSNEDVFINEYLLNEKTHQKQLLDIIDAHSIDFVIVQGVDALMNALDVTREVAEKLDKAFYKSFPKIREYQDWVTQHLSQYGYVENLYGRRYYMDDSRYYYRACNYLIQGTCADMVKTFEIKVYEYIKKNNLKSRLVLPIHDELCLSVPLDEMFVIKEVKRIMEDVTDVIKSIPMIAEPEVTYTNWAEKKEYDINE